MLSRWTRSGCSPTLRAGLCPDLLDVADLQGQQRQAAQRLWDAAFAERRGGGPCWHETLLGARFACGGEREGTALALGYLLLLLGLDWSMVADCVEAGYSPARAREHVAAGRDMAPVRVLRDLAMQA